VGLTSKEIGGIESHSQKKSSKDSDRRGGKGESCQKLSRRGNSRAAGSSRSSKSKKRGGKGSGKIYLAIGLLFGTLEEVPDLIRAKIPRRGAVEERGKTQQQAINGLAYLLSNSRRWGGRLSRGSLREIVKGSVVQRANSLREKGGGGRGKVTRRKIRTNDLSKKQLLGKEPRLCQGNEYWRT